MKISLLLVLMLMSIRGFAQAPAAPPAQPTTSGSVANTVGTASAVSAGTGVPLIKEAHSSDNEDLFVYDPTGKRDPFEPELPKDAVIAPKVNATNVTIPDHPLEPLESFEVDQLRVSAIIWDTRNPRALIMDPTGSSHYVKLKSRIGKKNGLVVAIREGEIVVVEYVEENGQYTKAFKVMELTR